jgi:hypothetical protein
MSVRQQIIDAMKTRFAGITKANGYNSDLGNSVLDWDTETSGSDPSDWKLPFCNIKDGNSECFIEVMGLFSHELAIDIEVFCTKGKSTAAEIRLILEDIFAAIGVDDTWGGLAQYTMFEDNDGTRRSINLVVEQYNKTIARATIKTKVLYRTNYWQI